VQSSSSPTTASTTAAMVERHDCPSCSAPAGSACRTRAGRTAAKYHTARFGLVPALRDDLHVPVPADRGPGRPWVQQPPVAAAPSTVAGAPIRIGYARCSTAGQELQSQLDALTAAGCGRIYSEKISTRVKTRPELQAALTLAREIKLAAGDQPVILTVHEMKRLARNAAELMTLAAALQSAGIQLELLTGPLVGIYDPTGMGSMLFAICAVAAQLDRDYIREKTLEGQRAAAARGNHGGRPKVVDDDMLTFARALRDRGEPIRNIAAKLTIKTGKNAGKHPSVASLYRALADPAPAGQAPPDRTTDGQAAQQDHFAAALVRLPVDTRPPPSVAGYDDLLPSRRSPGKTAATARPTP
jgi:DNA invertase Pin-like site-specific DNA recombinase